MKSIEEKEIDFFMNLLKNDPVNTISIPKHFVCIGPDKITNGLRVYTVAELQAEPNNRNYTCFRVPPEALAEVCQVLAKYANDIKHTV